MYECGSGYSGADGMPLFGCLFHFTFAQRNEGCDMALLPGNFDEINPTRERLSMTKSCKAMERQHSDDHSLHANKLSRLVNLEGSSERSSTLHGH